MRIDNKIQIDKLVHTKKTISSNIALQKESLAEQGKKMVDMELMVSASVGLIALGCFRVELLLVKHLLILLFAIILVTTLYIGRVSKNFTRLEKDLMERIDFKIETLRKTC